MKKSASVSRYIYESGVGRIAVNIIEDYVQSYGRLVFSICYRMTRDHFDAEDLTQETFLSAHRALRDFTGENPKAWLCTIAMNKCRDYLKSASRRSVPSESAGANLPAADNPEKEAIEKSQLAQLKELCERLNEPYRSAALKHFVLGLSVPEISQETGENPKTIHTRLSRARERLKIIWKEENG